MATRLLIVSVGCLCAFSSLQLAPVKSSIDFFFHLILSPSCRASRSCHRPSFHIFFSNHSKPAPSLRSSVVVLSFNDPRSHLHFHRRTRLVDANVTRTHNQKSHPPSPFIHPFVESGLSLFLLVACPTHHPPPLDPRRSLYTLPVVSTSTFTYVRLLLSFISVYGRASPVVRFPFFFSSTSQTNLKKATKHHSIFFFNQ